jgi:FlaA1/EpsC-like NDP-sugar epimerase
MNRSWRTWLAFLHDLAATALAWMGAFWLRFNFDIPPDFMNFALRTLPWVVALHAPIFIGLSLYRSMWRFASIRDLRRIVTAAVLGAVIIAAVATMLALPPLRSVQVLAPVLLVVIMGATRLAYRAWKERRFNLPPGVELTPVLVLGGGEAAANLIKDLARSRQWQVVGVLTPGGQNAGRELHGARVLGDIGKVARHAQALSVAHAIVAMPDAAHGARRKAVDMARSAGLSVLTVPSFDDLMSGKVTVSQVRHVELDDLLGRDPVTLDTAGLKQWIADRVVLVTGAGGSIGAELCRQVLRYQPQRLVLFDHDEYALYTIEQELGEQDPRIVSTIGDVKDAARVAGVLRDTQPAIVFHAAAYKHVPLMENRNAWQAVLNNVLGTRVTAEAAMAAGVEKFVLVSTDKAVNPTNVMGATKRAAELVCQTLQATSGTQFVMVRFGNVLGSTGSVIPRFREQIARGGPVTVTHPDITRFFMSIPEAVQLVLQAGLMGKGGEIFVLDMGEPVRITDLARELIRLSGYLESEIAITYTGLRPGEKLYEEPLAGSENMVATPHPRLHVARTRRESAQWLAAVSHWLAHNTDTDAGAVKRELARHVPEYQPQFTADG